MSSILDIIASEYGWHHDYILDSLSREQVEAYLRAISRRYDRQSKAIKKATSKGSSESKGLKGNTLNMKEDEAISIDKVFAKFKKEGRIDAKVLKDWNIEIVK